jgi:hypothetical protein
MSSDAKKSKDLGRLFNQIATVTKLVSDGKREPEIVSRYLQVVINERQRKGGSLLPFPFVSLEEQYEGFVRYNDWLRTKYPEYCIPKEEMIKAEEYFEKKNVFAGLLFYGHRPGNEVACSASLTAKLAIEYLLDRPTQVDAGDFMGITVPEFRRIIDPELEVAQEAPERPKGFFIGQLPSEDLFGGGIGMRFRFRKVSYVRDKVDQGEWLMGFEGIQLLAITHPHYVALLDLQIVPGMILPDLRYLGKPGGQSQLVDLAFGPLWDNYARAFDGCGISGVSLDDSLTVYGCGTYTMSKKI